MILVIYPRYKGTMYQYIYKITNSINNKIYINDGFSTVLYLVVKKYNKMNFWGCEVLQREKHEVHLSIINTDINNLNIKENT